MGELAIGIGQRYDDMVSVGETRRLRPRFSWDMGKATLKKLESKCFFMGFIRHGGM